MDTWIGETQQSLLIVTQKSVPVILVWCSYKGVSFQTDCCLIRLMAIMQHNLLSEHGQTIFSIQELTVK